MDRYNLSKFTIINLKPQNYIMKIYSYHNILMLSLLLVLRYMRDTAECSWVTTSVRKCRSWTESQE